MPAYQLLTCTIALAGDVTQTVVRHQFNPITYPEFIVIEFLHGEHAISDVFMCGETEDRDSRQERERLMHIYGPGPVEHLFPGHNIQMPVSNDRYKPRMVGTIVNPRVDDPGPAVMAAEEIDPDIARPVRDVPPEILNAAAEQTEQATAPRRSK